MGGPGSGAQGNRLPVASVTIAGLKRRILELEHALEHALQVTAAERQRADAMEAAYRRSLRVALHVPAGRQPVAPERRCLACERRFQPIRKDQVYCSGPCRQRHWQRLHRCKTPPSERRTSAPEIRDAPDP